MRALALVFCAALLAGCKDDTRKPYLEFAGGGFVFNYRNGEHFYGFVAKPLRSLPEGSVVEAHFEVPGSKEPYVEKAAAKSGQLYYSFKTPDLEGIVKDHPYKVEIVVLEGSEGKELARYSHTFKTSVDESMLPKEGLVVGPGYEPNPDLPKP